MRRIKTKEVEEENIDEKVKEVIEKPTEEKLDKEKSKKPKK